MLKVRTKAPNMDVVVGDWIFEPCVEEVIGKVVKLIVHTTRDMDMVIAVEPRWEKYVRGQWLADDFEESGDDLLCGDVVLRRTMVFVPDRR